MNGENMKAIIVGVEYYGMDYDLEESMRELEALCQACDIEVKAQMIQKQQFISFLYSIF